MRLSMGQDVEAGQASGDGHDVNVADHPREAAGGLKFQEVHEDCWRHSKRDAIDERIELGAEPGAGICPPGDASVQHVQDAGEDEEPPRPEKIRLGGTHHGPESKEQVAEGKGTRHDDHDLPHVRAAKAGAPWNQAHSAITVTPATVRSPSFTSTLAVGGTKTSTRDPKRIMPSRSPWATSRPTS